MATAWTARFRPKTFDEVVGNLEYVSRLRSIVNGTNVPNIILVGPAGCGKTTLLDIMCREYTQAVPNMVLSLSANDDRGMDAIRTKVKVFAQAVHASKRRVVIIDEMDGMTAGLQHSLQRIMELHSDRVVFFFTCNDSERIIDVIQSRCAVMRLNTVSDSDLSTVVRRVCETEKELTVTEDGLRTLVLSAQGDVRLLLNNMQVCRLHSNEITVDLVEYACDQPSPRKTWQVLELCAAGELVQALKLLKDIFQQGHSAQDVMSLMVRLIKKSDLPDAHMINMLVLINDAQVNICLADSSHVQLAELFVRIAHAVKHPAEKQTIRLNV